MTEHILIVEDDDDIQLMLRAGLEMQHYRLSFARDGQEALELLASIPPPSIMLLDLGLPRMNGYALLEALERQRPDLSLPVIIITADPQASARLAHKRVTVVTKPFSLYALFASIEETLHAVREEASRPHFASLENGNTL
jgi:DNA-binding response OmpR family regulator